MTLITDDSKHDELLRICVGDAAPNGEGVLIALHLKTVVDGADVIKVRPPMLFHEQIVDQLLGSIGSVFELLATKGVTGDVTVQDVSGLPDIDSGPILAEVTHYEFSAGFGFAESSEEDPAAFAVVLTVDPTVPGNERRDTYAVSYRAMRELQQVLSVAKARIDAVSAKPGPMTGNGGVRPPEVVRFVFGELMKSSKVVLVNLWIRRENGEQLVTEPSPPIAFDYDVVATLLAGLPDGIKTLTELGGARDMLPPPPSHVPEWNRGPSFNASAANMHYCFGFAINEFAPGAGAAWMTFDARRMEEDPEKHEVEYIVSYRCLKELAVHLPKVARKMEQAGATRTRLH